MKKQIANVYIAASSAEIERAQAWREKLALAGISVVSTWIETIQQVGDANPREASCEQRRTWVHADLAEIRAADLLWFLVPPTSAPTRGAWLEVGYASSREKVLVFSGDTKQSIFCALGREYDHDIDAFACICRLAREGVAA